jgi:hypothetical protein
MLTGNNNLKDLGENPGRNIKDKFSASDISDIPIRELSVSYTKTNKLITALYMVTDIIDKDEPMRNKLRTLGTGIISDMNSTPSKACSKIYEMMSFLDIASAVNIISEMNCNILKKEFSELNKSIQESTGKVQILNRQINLSEFFKEELPFHGAEFTNPADSHTSPNLKHSIISDRYPPIGHPIGHPNSTRLGVQKASTLLTALSDKNLAMSFKGQTSQRLSANSFEILKKQRQEEIIAIIKTFLGGATIKDIRDKIQSAPERSGSLVSFSEKTLQRELMFMIKSGVLNKTGKKRWSRYFLVSNLPSVNLGIQPVV